jgi:hypothetical protein
VRRAALLLLVPALVALAGCPAPPPWEFVSKEHKFKVRFGSEPDVSANMGAFTKTSVYSVESAAGALVVIVVDMPVPDDDPPGRAELYLNSARDDLVRAAGAELTADAPTTLAGKYPGREFAAKFHRPQPGVTRARIYLVGKRLYQVMVRGTEAYASTREADAFLESFMVTSE